MKTVPANGKTIVMPNSQNLPNKQPFRAPDGTLIVYAQWQPVKDEPEQSDSAGKSE